MKIIYVTGCLGFIGSHFTELALKKGYFVIGVDKCTYAADRSLIEHFSNHPNFKFIKNDINDLKSLYDCDFIVNFAAESHVGNSIKNSVVFMESNVLGIQNLLELIRFKKSNTFERPRLIHISTDEVYGDIETGSHTELDLLKPSNPYSASKAAADMLVMAWGRTYNVEYNLIRPTNNYGEGQYPEKLIPLAIKRLFLGKKIKLHNAGTPVRTWLHVKDTALAVMTVLERGAPNKIYNIAGAHEQTNLETVTKIIKAYFGDNKAVKDYLDLSYTRQGQDVRYALDDSRIRFLGWTPGFKFDEEIVSIVQKTKQKYLDGMMIL